nr:hypothetical protein B0A51_12460 [Rachicladosporium sp. CCFEE 5018]
MKHVAVGVLKFVSYVDFNAADDRELADNNYNEQGPLVAPKDQRALANSRHEKYFTSDGDHSPNSDHLAHINAFTALRATFVGRGVNATFRLSNDNLLHFGSFKTCMQNAEQIENILVEPAFHLSKENLLHFESFKTCTQNAEQIENDLVEASLISIARTIDSDPNLAECVLLDGLQPSLAVKGNKDAFPHLFKVHVSATSRLEERTQQQGLPFRRRGVVHVHHTCTSGQGDALVIRDSTNVIAMQAVLVGARVVLIKRNVLFIRDTSEATTPSRPDIGDVLFIRDTSESIMEIFGEENKPRTAKKVTEGSDALYLIPAYVKNYGKFAVKGVSITDYTEPTVGKD